MSDFRYPHMVLASREIVHEHVPRGATLLVATGGDEDLLRLDGPRVIEFPERGGPGGEAAHPASALAAIAQLEAQRAKGADFLLVPSSELWLLDEFPDFEQHLKQRYQALVDDEDVALLFALRGQRAAQTTAWDDFHRTISACERELRGDPAILDWRTELDLRSRFPDRQVFSPLEERSTLPYLDATVDLVAVPESATSEELEEARRVAKSAILIFPNRADDTASASLEVEWKDGRTSESVSAAVILPCRGRGLGVEAALFSLRETLTGVEPEIVLIADGSGPKWLPHERVQASDRIELIEVPADASHADACNEAASVAKSEVLVFVLPVGCLLPQWLPPLLSTCRDHEDAGAVGAKVMGADGELVHAGGHLLADGSAWSDGPGRPLDAPLYSCLRVVDYVSPAIIATPRDVFAAVGGFATKHPATLALDYCLRLRDQGYRTYYQPECTFVLLDPDSPSGTEEARSGRVHSGTAATSVR